MKKTTVAGQVLLTVLALFTGISPYLADWNASHIYNPSWPPHAKFHNAQTMSMAALLCLLSLFFIWRSRTRQRANIPPAVALVSLYWVSQAIAFTFPGVAWTDPDLLPPGQTLTQFPEQLRLDLVIFVLIAIAAAMLAAGGRGTRRRTSKPTTVAEPASSAR